MDAPREVTIAIVLSWAVLVAEAADRLWRIAKNPDAGTFSRLGESLVVATLSCAAVVAVFIIFAARRRNWARIGLLASTLGGWTLWAIWLYWFRAAAAYGWQQWLGHGMLAAMELVAVVLLFGGKGTAWYRLAKGE